MRLVWLSYPDVRLTVLYAALYLMELYANKK